MPKAAPPASLPRGGGVPADQRIATDVGRVERHTDCSAPTPITPGDVAIG